MDLRKYLIEFKDVQGGVIAGYRRSILHLVEVNCELNIQQHEWLWKWVPTVESDIQTFRHDRIKVTRVAEDVSFDAFWNLFSYKVGKKERAERLWNALREDEKAAAMAAIPKYKGFLANYGTAQAYPETWIGQRRWENEFR
jgi:hypothetical protein